MYHALALWQEGVGTMAGYYLRRFFPRRSMDREPERDPEPWLDDRMTQLYIQAVRLYVPEKYRGTVTVISSTAGPASRSGDVALGWGRVADTVEVARVPGNHVTCLTLHADKVAQVLEARLQAPDAVRNTGAA
jgi:thioesterase domain-containing protein